MRYALKKFSHIRLWCKAFVVVLNSQDFDVKQKNLVEKFEILENNVLYPYNFSMNIYIVNYQWYNDIDDWYMIGKLGFCCKYYMFGLLIDCKIRIEKIAIVVNHQDFISNELEKYFLWFLSSQLHPFIPRSRLAHTCLIPWFTIADKWQFKGASSWQNVNVSMRISKTILFFCS